MVSRTPALILPGLLFGLGLAISGMTNPAKVVGFLDVGGDWDPSLMFVMGGAVGSFALLNWLRRRGKTRPGGTRPAAEDLDSRLVLGAVVFGIGWGLSGFCPGPAVANLAALRVEALVFVPMMVLGMFVAQRAFGCDGST